MHNFCFDTQGNCEFVPGENNKPPPSAKLNLWPLCEQDGLIFVSYSKTGMPLAWNIPSLDNTGMTFTRWKRFKINSHPQETSENSVDTLHLSVVHGYQNARILKFSLEGPKLYALVKFERQKTRQFIFAMPTESDQIELLIGMAVHKNFNQRRLSFLLGLLPHQTALWPLQAFGMRAYIKDVSQDIPFWEHKSYVNPPALSAGDGLSNFIKQPSVCSLSGVFQLPCALLGLRARFQGGRYELSPSAN